MKTTLEIPDDLFKQVKAKAAMEGIKMKDFVASALRVYLGQKLATAKTSSKKHPFPLVKGPGGPLMRKMSNRVIAGLEEKEELENYRRSLGR